MKKNNRPSMLCVKKLTLKKAEASSVMESLDCNICSPQLTINDFTLPFSSYVSSDFHRIEDDATPGTWQQVKENTPTIIEL